MSEQEHTKEEWRPVVGFEGWYSVSSLGRVRRDCHGVNTYAGRILKPRVSPGGYLTIQLSRVSGKPHHLTVHRLVTAAFIGPRPPGLQVNHKNGAKDDNCIANLEYVSAKDNSRHAIDILGRSVRGDNCRNAKLTEVRVRQIFQLRADGMTLTGLAALFGVGKSTIGYVLAHKTWSHVKIESSTPANPQQRGD